MRFHQYTLPLVVCYTGGSILVIEVIATRILAPYFGNTIFTFSSVIGIILAALSLGYALGGRLADAFPKSSLFYGIITLGGLTVLTIQLAITDLLPKLGYQLSFIYGPPIASVILFFTPALVLGTLSPYAIRLQSDRFPKHGIGRTSGQIFFWSTAGSIIGTFLAGFYLIPQFGLTSIILGTGLSLTGLGLVGTVNSTPTDTRLTHSFIIASLGYAIVTTLTIKQTSYHPQTVYADDGLYSLITIRQGWDGHRPIRGLFLDNVNEGVVYSDNQQINSHYLNYYQLYQLLHPNPDRALVVGGGAFLVPRELIRHSSTIHVDVAEIEPSLVSISQQYFDLPTEHPQLHHHLRDGRRFLQDSQHQYQLIFSDAYSDHYVPPHLTTQEYFHLAKQRLSPNGLFIANFIGSLNDQHPSYFYSAIRTIQQVFPQHHIYAVDDPQSQQTQNIIFVGLNTDQPQLLRRAISQQPHHPFFSTLADHEIYLDDSQISTYPVLVDDYAPVEYLVGQQIKQYR